METTNTRTDVYACVTAKIVADLEHGAPTWQRPCSAGHPAGDICRPLRANGQPYRGVNVLLLWAEALGKGYNAPIWMTYKQAATMGAQVIPLNPTPVDLRALVKGLAILRASDWPFNFVLTRVRANLRNNESAALALESLGLVISTRIHERVIFAENFAHGKTAFEVDPHGVDAEEMSDVREAVKLKLEESKQAGKRESNKARV